VDGNKNTISVTKEEAGAWFEVDLGQLVNVERIEIWSRDGYETRLVGATISLIDDNDHVWGRATISEAREVHTFGFGSRDDNPSQLFKYDTQTHQIRHGTGTSLTVARKVKVHLDRYEELNLAEVKVFDRNSIDQAFKKDTSQSSLYSKSYPPSNAVDGNKNTISVTKEEAGAWFEVDLGQLVNVERIEIWSRDGYETRLVGATISLIDDNDHVWGRATISEAREVHTFLLSSFSMSPTLNTKPLCLDYGFDLDDKNVYMSDCHEENNQKWLYDSNTKELKTLWDDRDGKKCLVMEDTGNLFMGECQGGDNQKFTIPPQWLPYIGYLDEEYEQLRRQSYEWIVRKEVGDGLRDDSFFCPADTAKGKWKPIQPLNAAYYEIGINRTTGFPYWEQSPSWEDSVTTSVTGGFKFGNHGIKVPWIDAKEMETSVRSVLHDLALVSNEDTSSGQAWQFIYEISDACAPMWELKTKDLVVTKGVDQEPCCLPGQELDADQPHGPCKFQSACQCEDYVCYPSAAPTSTPATAPTSVKDTASASADDEDSNSGGKLSTAYWVWIVVIVASIAFGGGCITDTANGA